MSRAANGRDLLRRGLGELGCSASEGQARALWELAALLCRWSERMNLTAHQTPEGVVRRLVLDAAALLRALPPFESAADLGSGAGFPGLPMAVLAPERSFVLVEARARRHHFQRAAIRELRLENVQARLGRAESLPPEPCAAVLAQAMAQPRRALAWMLPWAREGGLLAIPGGEHAPEPGESAEIDCTEVRTYQVPLEGPRRTLWLGRRRVP
jgi:16S rRNA (guanine527-N7)-methyltransferase